MNNNGNDRQGKRSSGNSNGGKKPNKDKFEWKKASKTLTFWILLILGSIVISQLYTGQRQHEADIPYTEYISLLESGQIESGTVINNNFHGVLRPEASRQLSTGGKTFKTVLPYIDSKMLESWDEQGISYTFKEKSTNWFGYLLSSILPWVLLIGIWILIMRRMQGGGTRGIFSFGKSRAKLLTENHPRLTFDDVAGADEAKEELQEIIEFLKDPKKFQKLGGRIPRGALLLGPPGTGKTLLAKAVAGEAGVPFFSMSGADFVEMFVGVGASRVRDLFEQGKKSAPCIIFIDEIDAVGRHRGAGLGGGHDEREQTLNQLLVEMDGFDSNEGVILIAATNRPDVLDPALLRPGRFDRQIVVDRPDVRGRVGIFKVHTKRIPLDRDVNLDILAKGTPGLSGADIESIVNEAALIAAKRDAKRVSMEDFERAKDKVMMGAERKSLLISDREKKNTAYHEAGHVLVAKMIPESDPVHKVTIIPRGRALGLTHFLPIDEKHNYSRKYLENMLTHLLGGRSAEKIVLDELTTGAGNDIERATTIARKMVCEWGMSDKMGPLAFGSKEEEIFLGKEFSRHRDYSDKTAIEIDEEVKRIVMNAEKRANDLIRANLDKLHALSHALLEREILDGHEIDLIMQGKTLKPIRKSSKKSSGRRGRRSQRKSSASKNPQEKPAQTKPQPDDNKPKQNGSKNISKTFTIKSENKPADSPGSNKTNERPKAAETGQSGFKESDGTMKTTANQSVKSEPKTPSRFRRAAGRKRSAAKNETTDSSSKPENTKAQIESDKTTPQNKSGSASQKTADESKKNFSDLVENSLKAIVRDQKTKYDDSSTKKYPSKDGQKEVSDKPESKGEDKSRKENSKIQEDNKNKSARNEKSDDDQKH